MLGLALAQLGVSLGRASEPPAGLVDQFLALVPSPLAPSAADGSPSREPRSRLRWGPSARDAVAALFVCCATRCREGLVGADTVTTRLLRLLPHYLHAIAALPPDASSQRLAYTCATAAWACVSSCHVVPDLAPAAAALESGLLALVEASAHTSSSIGIAGDAVSLGAAAALVEAVDDHPRLLAALPAAVRSALVGSLLRSAQVHRAGLESLAAPATTADQASITLLAVAACLPSHQPAPSSAPATADPLPALTWQLSVADLLQPMVMGVAAAAASGPQALLSSALGPRAVIVAACLRAAGAAAAHLSAHHASSLLSSCATVLELCVTWLKALLRVRAVAGGRGIGASATAAADEGSDDSDGGKRHKRRGSATDPSVSPEAVVAEAWTHVDAVENLLHIALLTVVDACARLSELDAVATASGGSADAAPPRRGDGGGFASAAASAPGGGSSLASASAHALESLTRAWRGLRWVAAAAAGHVAVAAPGAEGGGTGGGLTGRGGPGDDDVNPRLAASRGMMGLRLPAGLRPLLGLSGQPSGRHSIVAPASARLQAHSAAGAVAAPSPIAADGPINLPVLAAIARDGMAATARACSAAIVAELAADTAAVDYDASASRASIVAWQRDAGSAMDDMVVLAGKVRSAASDARAEMARRDVTASSAVTVPSSRAGKAARHAGNLEALCRSQGALVAWMTQLAEALAGRCGCCGVGARHVRPPARRCNGHG